MAKAGGNEAAAPIQKPALRMVDIQHQAGGNAETRIEEDAPVVGEAGFQSARWIAEERKTGVAVR